ncbi:hypothetical protein NBRC3279_1924 [Acetobacter pasteurianus NBRC 3279]|nr:hypothetical protein NBRC3279_1924 [Acetobacter pasteurianus NBRC 3279]GCD72742.1 hypothetical protein NBRC3284_1898 [Acetobacter pasteurianus NBRC 3284]
MTDSHETNHAAEAGNRHADDVRPAALCADAWFDMYPTASRLRVVVKPQFQNDTFWVPVELAGSVCFVKFTLVSFVRGEKVFEASEICWECDPRLVLQSPMFRLSGPHQGGLQVVS